MTGTPPDRRRKGLARLAKLGTIAWAREEGYEAILHGERRGQRGHAPPQRSLGYRPAGTETQYLLEELR